VKLEVLTSGIWQTNSTIVSHGDACIVIDPAYFPRELEAIAARVGELGWGEAVVFTHGHWDHVMGHRVCPEAPVWISRVLEASIAAGEPRAAKYLEDAREFDSRWYVPRPEGHHWPAHRRAVSEGKLELAGLKLWAFELPGHSPDGLGLAIEDVLLVGDYLSACEIPFVEDAVAYRETLGRLLELMRRMREVIPGHGPRLSRDEAMAIARADLEYVDRLLDAAARKDAAASAEIALPRATSVVGMRDHHHENLAKLGLQKA
jgi:hydroxyacylglutathione hydrolase